MSSDLVRYGPEVKELAFACYVQAGYNVSRATAILAHRLDGDPCPDRSVVSRWARDGQWKVRATEAIAQEFPYLNVEHAARLVEMTDDALDTYKAVMNGELDHLKTAALLARVGVAKHVLDLRGLGTSGARYGAGELPGLPPSVSPDDAELSPQERQRRRLDADEP